MRLEPRWLRILSVIRHPSSPLGPPAPHRCRLCSPAMGWRRQAGQVHRAQLQSVQEQEQNVPSAWKARRSRATAASSVTAMAKSSCATAARSGGCLVPHLSVGVFKRVLVWGAARTGGWRRACTPAAAGSGGSSRRGSQQRFPCVPAPSRGGASQRLQLALRRLFPTRPAAPNSATSASPSPSAPEGGCIAPAVYDVSAAPCCCVAATCSVVLRCAVLCCAALHRAALSAPRGHSLQLRWGALAASARSLPTGPRTLGPAATGAWRNTNRRTPAHPPAHATLGPSMPAQPKSKKCKKVKTTKP